MLRTGDASSQPVFNGGTLLLDSNAATTGTGNTAGNHVTQNRIRDDAVIKLHRANFDLVANANSTTTETIGTVNKPLRGLTETELCPGNHSLQKINASFR